MKSATVCFFITLTELGFNTVFNDRSKNTSAGRPTGFLDNLVRGSFDTTAPVVNEVIAPLKGF
jgi:hypothetical protein